jgi:hypothetical protein
MQFPDEPTFRSNMFTLHPRPKSKPNKKLAEACCRLEMEAVRSSVGLFEFHGVASQK